MPELWFEIGSGGLRATFSGRLLRCGGSNLDGKARPRGKRTGGRAMLQAAVLLGLVSECTAFLSSCFGIPCLDVSAGAAMCSSAPPDSSQHQIFSPTNMGRLSGEFVFHTDDGRVVMMDAHRAVMGAEERSPASPLRVYSGDYAEFAGGCVDDEGMWEVTSSIVPFRNCGFGVSGPVGGRRSLRLRGGSTSEYGEAVKISSPDNATEPGSAGGQGD